MDWDTIGVGPAGASRGDWTFLGLTLHN
jgi:hypothetical protein